MNGISESRDNNLEKGVSSADEDAEQRWRPVEHPPARVGKIGVLLVNLGTPERADTGAVRKYLAEFLSDRRVIEAPRALWLPLLYGPILTFRAPKAARLYRSIWLNDRDGSPLRKYTREQADGLQARLDKQGEHIAVDWAMRYGAPSIEDRLAALKSFGCDRILTLALYPQYSATTTASVYDAAFEALKKMRWQPAIRTAPPYHDDPAYIEAVAGDMEEALAKLDFEPEVILASFHGLPKKYFEKGDPYYCHCAKTTRLLRARLGLDEARLRMTFQSRFGPQEWLAPYTDKTLEALPGEGAKRVAVVTPGFASDCLETLEEIAIANRRVFMNSGGEKYAALPCLNAGDRGVDLIEALARCELAGWA